MRLQCNLKGPELFLEGGGVKYCARSPLRPGSRARSRALEALGLLMLSDAISALFWTITICLKPFLLLSQQYFMHYILCNCNNFVIYKMITIIVIILDHACVLKRT